MHRSHVLLAISLLAPALAARAAAAAWVRDPSANLPICAFVSNQNRPTVAPDGSGGVFIAWHDDRTGTFGTSEDIYVQHVSAKGVPLWTANGVAVCTRIRNQRLARIVPDGSGGAIIAWIDQSGNLDFDVYAQRVNGSGVPQWTANGVALCIAANNQDQLALIGDGAGGAIAAWRDNRSGDGGDIYAQRVNGVGAVLWGATGVALATASGTQQTPQLVSDGNGGAIACWVDFTLFTQRLNGAGVAQWTPGGIQITNFFTFSPSITTDGAGGAILAFLYLPASSSEDGAWAVRVTSSGQKLWAGNPEPGTALLRMSAIQNIIDILELVTDGAGGAIAVWTDRRNGSSNRDLFARRVNASGVALWANNGVAVCTAPGDQEGWLDAVSDGRGGLIVTWHDPRADGVTLDAYAQRLDPNGVQQWGTNGALLSTAVSSQSFPSVIMDGREGAVVAWEDTRASANADIYAQRIDLYGNLGDASPEISYVRDVPNDQGERVRIRWNASYRDTMPTLNVGTYGIWRQVTEAAAAQAIARGARMSASGETREAKPGTFRAEESAVQTTWWEGVGSIPARGEPWYTFVAETFQDSTAAGNPLTTFMVDAHDANVPAFWTSLSEPGYSVDNLPPGIPMAFAGSYSGGATQLTWNPNVENDLAAYRLYRGATANFVPSPANRIATPTTTSYSDPGPSGSFYKLSAVDIHANESGYTTPVTTTGIGEAVPRELSFARPSPNPAHADVALRYALPRASRVSLVIHDVSGRIVRRLVDGVRPAGESAITWDLRDDRGSRVNAGHYFARFECEGQRLTQELVAIR